MKKAFLFSCFLILCLPLMAQHSTASYDVLRLPVSSHVSALGGDNITLIEDNPAIGWTNPALLSSVSDNSLGLDFMTYGHKTQFMGAQFVKGFGNRHTAAIGVQMMNYGSMEETDELGNVVGTVHAKDIVVGLGYSYVLSERFVGGASLKMTSQSYGGYNSFALGVDVGLNYYDEDKDFSASLTFRNAGAQVKSFYDGEMLHLPFMLQLGVSKGFAHLPIRFHVLATDLTRWKTSDYYHPSDVQKIKAGQMILNHLILGLDIMPTKNFYLSVGYNFRRGYELKSADASKFAGLTCGAGISVKKFKIGLSYARYHVSTNGFHVNLAYSFSK
ncbi:MAG: type IX secretion system protein PorQ [Alloprevotella sp.]|nr:type IX secretion system protein PorQ [Alloprevotella sp.]